MNTATRRIELAKAQAKARADAEAEADRIIRELAAEFRRRKDLTYYALAKAIGGGSQINLKAVLEGKERPGLDRALAIAAALGKTLMVENSK